ncbi:uncharacterized protein NEMAJ01_2015 [Nematocida major]|uniref:uncharacterized protein n=1 Tax=Nematocida major TaxID=1912982 RepID=UPI002008C62D|nr:uncharacterized protein NEMAJ01_2015 [Nematocida major]KAH9387119.1 hypothetical protein NEMAJ01_2015 [Nematocida major]
MLRKAKNRIMAWAGASTCAMRPGACAGTEPCLEAAENLPHWFYIDPSFSLEQHAAVEEPGSYLETSSDFSPGRDCRGRPVDFLAGLLVVVHVLFPRRLSLRWLLRFLRPGLRAKAVRDA